ncbi:MAG: hypothetical protein GXP55_21075 [Deltaproteobacteria bacterium]|nr:hypothetical protein [Deltaproteobacteria bacterium]
MGRMHTLRVLTLLACSLGILGLSACASPPVDAFRSEGGAAPDPTGVMEGTILYVGPKPSCHVDAASGRNVPDGRAVLLLFAFDNPPPPEGAATTALNLLTVPGIEFFPAEADCRSEANPTEQIMRSASFVWPEIELGHPGRPAAYQVRGFYDDDGDFNPFFSATNLPTAGDIGGGAVVDAQAAIPHFVKIEFANQEDSPNGDVQVGVAVALGSRINTERPIFSLVSGALSAEATLPTTRDAVAAEGELFALTNSSLHLMPRDSGGDPAETGVARCVMLQEADGSCSSESCQMCMAAASGGIELAFDDPVAYAWYVRDIDANGDGITDLHPILGDTNGILWETPGVILQRAQSPIELQAGIPSVLLLPTVRPTQTAFNKVFYPDIQIAVPPVAVVQTHPTDVSCRIPYITPGNPTSFYERITVDCQELPSGRYAVNVLHGIAGGIPLGTGTQSCVPPRPIDPNPCPGSEICVDNVCSLISVLSPQTGRDIFGGLYSSQAWTIPNELGFMGDGTNPRLGPPQQIDSPYWSTQGIPGMFIVQDPNPGDTVGRLDERDGCKQAVDPALLAMGMTPAEATRDIVYPDFSEFPLAPDPDIGFAGVNRTPDEERELCCAPVRHLCGVPLCASMQIKRDPADDSSETFNVRATPTSLTSQTMPDGTTRQVPNCVPFLMPAACCLPAT